MPINKKSRVNNVITWLHLWLGLISGVIVVIVSVTGCLFCFQTEISAVVRRKMFFIEAPSGPATPLPMHTLLSKAEAALHTGRVPDYVTAYSDPDRAWEFMDYQPGDPGALTFPGTLKSYRSVFLNPYTGEVTGEINYLRDFFIIVKYIHWSLFLNTRYGQPIVGWGTLVFVVSLITGFIMWIPRRWSKRERADSFTVRWKAGWKRLNYDLHNVLGFYAVLVALVLGLTGMIYSFRWFSKAVYATATLSADPPRDPVYVSDTSAASFGYPEDRGFRAVRADYPDARRYSLAWPATPEAPLAFTAYPGKEVYYNGVTEYFDRYSGSKLGKWDFSEQNAGEKIIALNYDIHVGSIGGLGGKIIAFLVSLICASLPVTGFVIWWGKKKKKSGRATRRRTPGKAVLQETPA